MKIIDFHTHLQEEWLGKKLLNAGQFVAGMDRCGIEKACIFTLAGFYGNAPAENDRLVNDSAEFADRLIPFVTVDPKLGASAVAEVDRCLSNPRFRGVKFHSWLQSFAPSLVRETMIAILRCAAKHRAPVLFHDGTPPYSTTFQIAALARWVPECTVVLGHGGLADYIYPAGQLMREIPNLYACICCPKAGDVEYLVKAGGIERITWGSDFGFANWRMIEERLDDVRESNLNETQRERVFYTNSAKLLKLT
jgi:predicted TIM-barrel fold metal-dependent hydrolase